MSAEHLLLDVTDRKLRPLQHGVVLAGVVVLLVAGAAAKRPEGIALTLWMIAGGLALIGAAAAIRQKWAVTYKGHDVRFENNPLLGEKLFIDNTSSGKGKLGYRSEIRAVIASGEGAGDTVIARTEAGLLTLRCRITAEGPGGLVGVPSAVSDEQLLAEARRRGLMN